MKIEIEVDTLLAFVEGAEDLLKQAKSRLCVVRLDETHHWSPGLLEPGEKAYGIYLVDLNEQTYCAELTPSYYLYHLYNVGNEEVQSYQSGDDESIYAHCRTLDALPAIDSHPLQPIELTELTESYEKFIEDNIEHLAANHVFY